MNKQDKMTIEIDHEDMVNMVCGLGIEYDDIPTLEQMGLGYRNSAVSYDWEWNRYAVEELSTEELYDMYTQIKKKYKIQLTEEGRIQLPQEKQCDFTIVWDVEKLKKYYALERELCQF